MSRQYIHNTVTRLHSNEAAHRFTSLMPPPLAFSYIKGC